MIPCACGMCNKLVDETSKNSRGEPRRFIVNHDKRLKRPHKLRENSPNWHGGRYVDKHGYVHIYRPEHPHAVSGYIPEHRLVIEQHIGRILDPEEIVHHKGGNTTIQDNRIENLQLLSIPEHMSHHHKGKIISKNTRKKQSEAMKGRQIWLGKKHSEDSRKKMSESRKQGLADGSIVIWNKGISSTKK